MIDDFKQVPAPRPGRFEQPIPSAVNQETKTERPAPAFRSPDKAGSDSLFAASPATSAASAAPTTPSSSPTDTKSALAAGENELLLPPHARGAAKPAGATITLFKKWTVSKKKFIIIASVAAVILLGGGGAAAYALTRSPAPVAKKPVATKAKAAVAPTPAPIVSPLTGITVTPEQRDLPVIGVMIENSPDARPQSGLKEAGVVYEAIAEAGITRFLALFQESHPGNVGPIRSSRPYYLDWAVAFDASYAHVGGSPDALQRIKDINVKDMDQFFNPAAYHRITSRYAPHNVYTSIDQLTDLAKSKGYDKSSFTSFARKAEKPYAAPTPTPSPTPAPAGTKKTTTTAKPTATESRAPVKSIDLGISGAYYNAHYDYDAPSNNYKRSEGGEPHMDFDSKTQLAPKVVIALAMPYSLMADGYHSAYTTTGSGKMFVFQDGTVVTGTWSKGEPKEQFVFKDDAGKTLELNPGQTWISIVSDASKVTYQ